MIDVTRHRSIFDPNRWGRTPVHVIGLGATGSKIALSLARLGVQNLHLWDGDTVEDHNIANQAYPHHVIGDNKANAMRQTIESITSTATDTNAMNFHDHYWEGQGLSGVVFAMVDSMAVRKQIFEACRYNPFVHMLIDSRMGVDHAMLYSLTPTDTTHAKRYEATLYSDDDAQTEVSACGTAITVGPTGDIISGYAVWRFIRHAQADESPSFSELAIGTRPGEFIAQEV